MSHHQEQNRLVTEAFIRDTAQHQMTVLRDDGVYRHIRFAKPGTRNMSFDLVTWPGYLCYAGDMGEFVFSRLTDMFEFFRAERADKLFEISHGYWAEKCQAGDKPDGIEKFSEALFRENIQDSAKQYADGEQLDGDVRDAFMQEVADELIEQMFDSEVDAFRAAGDFQFDRRFPFESFWEVNCRDYSYRFRWCCRALRWGIAMYDRAKAPPSEAAE